MLYGYDDLTYDLSKVKGVYSIGKTLFNREIFAVNVGRGAPLALIHGGIHGRECVTSAVVIDMIKNYNGAAVCFVPMVNPDGVMLCKYGLTSAPNAYRNFLYAANGGYDFKMWKANGRAVDINVNFDADWGKGAQNRFYPSPESYIGKGPFSENESAALRDLTNKYKFPATISLHTKGEIVYYGYKHCKNYKKYVKIIADELNYPYQKTPGSTGGYKDWYLSRGYGFGITVELGDDSQSHPLGLDTLPALYEKVKNLPSILADIGDKLWTKNL